MDTVPIKHADGSDLSEIGDLLAGVARGEPAAFDRLYMSTRARLFGLIYTTVRDPGIAEEVMQEAYLEVWHKAHLYQPHKGNPLSWLMMICHRRGPGARGTPPASGPHHPATAKHHDGLLRQPDAQRARRTPRHPVAHIQNPPARRTVTAPRTPEPHRERACV